MQANACCESKQTTICENRGKWSLSLPDLYSFRLIIAISSQTSHAFLTKSTHSPVMFIKTKRRKTILRGANYEDERALGRDGGSDIWHGSRAEHDRTRGR